MYHISISYVKSENKTKPTQYFQYQLEWCNWSLELYCALPYLFYQQGMRYNQAEQSPLSHVTSTTDIVFLNHSK